MSDPEFVGRRVQARLLVSDGAGRVLAAGEPPVLPGGPLGSRSDLAVAALEEAHRHTGMTARVGAPLAVTVTEESGLTVLFDAQVDEAGTARFVDAARVTQGVPATEKGRIRYREELWWPVEPSGPRGRFPDGLGALLQSVTDDDITSWILGVLLGVFPTDSPFRVWRGLWWVNNDPLTPAVNALHRVLMALAKAGILDEDAGLEFSWSARVDVR